MSSDQQKNHERNPLSGMDKREFVVMMAALMSITAMSIDTMLPALPQIGEDLQVADPNDRQGIITFFMFGLAIGALFYGPLSDRFGRRRVLMLAAVLQFMATLICALSTSFPILLGARLLAGFSIASCRVIATSIVRDCFQGDAMARVMSLIMVTFVIVPVLAPTLGSLVLLVAPWRWIFGLLLFLILVLAVWQFFRLPETLPPEHRTAIGPRDLWATFMTVVRNRNSIGHLLASGIMLGGLIGFLVSVQQIFFDVFHAGEYFALGFASIAMWMGVGSLMNSRLVERFGARRLSQTAIFVLIAISIIHCGIILAGQEHLLIFIICQAVIATCFSFSSANFSSIALEPFRKGAGLASSVQASVTTLVSTLLGGLIGASFDGTVLPLSLGFLVFGLVALVLVLWAERWKLFQRPGFGALRKEKYLFSDRG